MSIQHLRKLRQAGAVTLVSATLALAVTACGSGEDSDGSESASTNSSPQRQGADTSEDGQDAPDAGNSGSESDNGVTVKGDSGIDMVVQSAKRDSGGFVTLNGAFKNTSGDSFTVPIEWNGQEQSVAGTGNSIAAMTLIDTKDKKRYYVLRDTDNRPLTTVGYKPSIAAGESLTFFAQFPAPPQSTTSVDLQFPGFPDTSIEIS